MDLKRMEEERLQEQHSRNKRGDEYISSDKEVDNIIQEHLETKARTEEEEVAEEKNVKLPKEVT